MKQRLWLIQVAAGRAGASEPLEHHILTTGLLPSSIREIIDRNDGFAEIRIDISSLREGTKQVGLVEDWVEAYVSSKPPRKAKARAKE